VVCRYCGRDLAEPQKPAPHVIQEGVSYQCSECKGWLRKDATTCKHCGVSFRGAQEVKAQAKKSSALRTVIVISLGTLAIFAALIFMLPGRGASTPRAVPGSTSYRVEYQAQGTARTASLTYQSAGGFLRTEGCCRALDDELYGGFWAVPVCIRAEQGRGVP
jgi:hypothetical protein